MPASLSALAAVAALAFAAWHWGQAATVHAKAWLAPILIERAWRERRARRVEVRPWPWADTWPVARMTVPERSIERYVLAGANGASLPFGPGHLSGSALPGQRGTIVIAGHRDTHFRFAGDLSIGTLIVLEGIDGVERSYAVVDRSIVDARLERLHVDRELDLLLLVTCEPTAAFTSRGPYRLVISALPVVSTTEAPWWAARIREALEGLTD